MLLNYIKIAWKVLLRHPFYTFVTLFGISLTLTVLMVLTSFLDHLIGSHYPEDYRGRMLYVQRVVKTDTLNNGRQMGPASYNFLKKYVSTLKTPEKTGVATVFSFANAYAHGRRIELNTKYTDAGFWEVTNFRFLEGKPYNETNIANGDHVAVITDELKHQYFGLEDETAVGKSIEVDNVTYRVIGVVKGVPATRPVTAADIYFPYNVTKSNYQQEGFSGNYTALILARNRADISAIKEEYNQVISRIPLPQTQNGWTFQRLESSAETYVDGFLYSFLNRPAGGIFYSVIVLFMLLFMGLPAINLVNLNVSRIMERASEIGIRKAFGAPARTLVWQFIIENIFITGIGGAIALIFSLIVIYLINQSGWIAHADLTINLPVFGISLLVCLTFGFLSGVLPALRMARLNIVSTLRSAG